MEVVNAPHASMFRSGSHLFWHPPFNVLRYGIGGTGKGWTPQTADAQDGSGGVLIREPLPCLEGEQLGSIAGLQVEHVPVKVLMLG